MQPKYDGVRLFPERVAKFVLLNDPKSLVMLKSRASVDLSTPMYVCSEELTTGRLKSPRMRKCVCRSGIELDNPQEYDSCIRCLHRSSQE